MAKKIVIATRLHLGNASSAPSESKLQDILKNFERLGDLVEDFIPVIAVDATPKIEKYDYVQAIRSLLPKKSKIEITTTYYERTSKDGRISVYNFQKIILHYF